MQNHRVLQWIPTMGLQGILNQEGIHVFNLLFFHDHVPFTDQASVLMTFICMGSN